MHTSRKQRINGFRPRTRGPCGTDHAARRGGGTGTPRLRLDRDHATLSGKDAIWGSRETSPLKTGLSIGGATGISQFSSGWQLNPSIATPPSSSAGAVIAQQHVEGEQPAHLQTLTHDRSPPAAPPPNCITTVGTGTADSVESTWHTIRTVTTQRVGEHRARMESAGARIVGSADKIRPPRAVYETGAAVIQPYLPYRTDCCMTGNRRF
ncbi:MAG: hypothetical protein AAGB48_07600 [Planctomycetota bacterium]